MGWSSSQKSDEATKVLLTSEKNGEINNNVAKVVVISDEVHGNNHVT
jgi:hypothetical protein